MKNKERHTEAYNLNAICAEKEIKKSRKRASSMGERERRQAKEEKDKWQDNCSHWPAAGETLLVTICPSFH